MFIVDMYCCKKLIVIYNQLIVLAMSKKCICSVFKELKLTIGFEQIQKAGKCVYQS